MKNKLRLKIITPGQTVFDRETNFVLLRTTKGDMGVLPGHEPYAVLLADGLLRASVDKQEEVFEVRGGFAVIQDDEVAVMTGLAGRPEEMEALLAGMEREREQRRQREEAANLEMRRVEEALRRALVHMEVSTDALIRGHEENLGDNQA